MSDQLDNRFDPDLLWLLSLVEHRVQEIKKMTSSIEGDSEDALATETLRSDAACCEFSCRVSASSLEGLNDLLDMALSAEFCKYHFNLLSH